jgi:deazaflavin-dependent oxidoreductase (nitroreductase family)
MDIASTDPNTESTNPNTVPIDFAAGSPRRSGPIRRLVLALAPVLSPLAGTRWFPLWAILRHTGRSSGKGYATPVVGLATPDGFIIPLPFGDATQWARNVFAAGGGTIRLAGREHRVAGPRVVDHEVAASLLPAPVAFMARKVGIRQYVVVRRVSS